MRSTDCGATVPSGKLGPVVLSENVIVQVPCASEPYILAGVVPEYAPLLLVENWYVAGWIIPLPVVVAVDAAFHRLFPLSANV
jgi:hypothetical protein